MGLTYYLPNISGVTQYAVILAEELAKRKYKIGVITARYKNGLTETEEVGGVKITRVPGFSINKGFIMPGYAGVSRKLVKETEVVICHLPSLEAVILAVWARIYRKKLIIVHHCEFGFSGNWKNKLIAMASFPVHWWTYRLADKVVAYTKDYAEHSVFLRLFREKLVFILPPIKINPPPFPSLDRAGRKSVISKHGKKRIVGFVGRIAWEKGLGILVKAMEKVDAKLMLVGPYKDVAGDQTYKKLKKVELVGPIAHEKLNKYYEKFDCLVLPSTDKLETFGIVQAEAMVCGTPVVASNLPGVRMPVKMTGMGEIARIGDVEDLARKIRVVLKTGKKYYQKIARNLDKFDYRKTADKFEELLAGEN